MLYCLLLTHWVLSVGLVVRLLIVYEAISLHSKAHHVVLLLPYIYYKCSPTYLKRTPDTYGIAKLPQIPVYPLLRYSFLPLFLLVVYVV